MSLTVHIHVTVDLKKEGKLTNFNESKHNCKQHFFSCVLWIHRSEIHEHTAGFKLSQKEKKKIIITSMFLMMTHFPFVYRKLLPLGSPPITFEVPLVICGSPANMLSERRSGGISNWHTLEHFPMQTIQHGRHGSVGLIWC